MKDLQNYLPVIPINNDVAVLTSNSDVSTLYKITYTELHHITDQVAAGLSQKFDPKSVVAVHLPESMD
ncbi:MAG: hypothetical protein SFW07_08370, partial [Gammaproteobacteria bacterium]|nr:hypothetical protein [Gammaproteobacteria bacterium]